MTQKAPPEPPADPPAPDPPAPVDPPAPPAHADAPEAPAPGGDGSQPDIEAALPDLEAVVPDLDAAVPDLDAPPPAADTVAPVAPVTGGGNTNISIRIFSPGDNGPVNQAGGGGTTPAAPDTTPAPTTWIWNWTWNGSPDCLPAPPGNVAPPGLGDWTWTWTWTCDGAIPVRVPGGGVVPAIPPGLDDALPGIEIAAGVLPPVVPVDAFEIAAQVAPVSLPDALPSPLAAGRRTPARADALVEPHPAPAPLRPAAASAPVMPATTVPASPEPAQERAARRHRDRDTTRGDGLVSAPVSPAGVAIAAASGAAAAAGSAPAVLTLTLTVLAAFLASALLQIAGLPRLLLRAARLERPG